MNLHRFKVGQIVAFSYEVNSIKELDPTDGVLYRRLVRRPINVQTGIVVGATHKTIGRWEMANGRRVFRRTETKYVWKVAMALLNKPILVLDQDLLSGMFTTRALPIRINTVTMNPEARAEMRLQAQNQPRAGCGRWIKRCYARPRSVPIQQPVGGT